MTMRLALTLVRVDKGPQHVLLRVWYWCDGQVGPQQHAEGDVLGTFKTLISEHVQEKALTVMAFACDVLKAG